MSRFIWIKDRDGREHYVNVKHVVRVTKVPPNATLKSPGYSYVVMTDGKECTLGGEKNCDTYEDIISKIQAAMA